MWDVKPPKQFYWKACDWDFYRLLKQLQRSNGMGGIIGDTAFLLVPNWEKPSKSYVIRERVE
jgi:hypothetical protein